MANQYKNKVVYGSETIIDLSNDTVTDASHIMNGYVGHLADGSQVTGTGGVAQAIYCGTSVPSSSLGSDGDLYFLMETGKAVERYPVSYDDSSIYSTSNLSKCIGVSAEDGTATGNVYSSGSGTTGTVDYSFDLSDIPSDAEIISVSCDVKAHEENASRSTMTLQLYAGYYTAKGSQTTVSGTSNQIYSLDCGTWTRSELDNLLLRMEVGYYGGLIAGATLTVVYKTDAHWGATLSGNNSGITIAGSNMYLKSSGSWTKTASTALDDLIARKDT